MLRKVTNTENETHGFYHEALELLAETQVPFLLGGAFALFHYTGIHRDTKDLDIFCRPRDYPAIMDFFTRKGYEVELHDARWLAKLFKGEFYVDLIFDTANNLCMVDDRWFKHAEAGKFLDIKVNFISPEDLIRNKIYIQNRERFDGADVNHLLLKCGTRLDWKRLLTQFDSHWQLLLAQITIFQFVYPSDFHQVIPQWVYEDLMQRGSWQYHIPSSVLRVCRGPLIDQTQYGIDVYEWGYHFSTIKTI